MKCDAQTQGQCICLWLGFEKILVHLHFKLAEHLRSGPSVVGGHLESPCLSLRLRLPKKKRNIDMIKNHSMNHGGQLKQLMSPLNDFSHKYDRRSHSELLFTVSFT